jgi:hypothetical protein
LFGDEGDDVLLIAAEMADALINGEELDSARARRLVSG